MIYSTISNAEAEGVQLNLFGDTMLQGVRPKRGTDAAQQRRTHSEPMEEAPEKRIIGGIDIEEALKYDLIHYGTGFQDGKFRIEQFYREHGNDTTEFAKFLAKEYGTGGHSCEGKVSMSWHDSKGIGLKFKLDNGEKTSVTWNWKKIASRLVALIENQTYITQKDIDDRIRSAKYEMAHNDVDSKEYRAAAEILDNYGLLPEKEDVQRIEPSEIKAGDSFMYRGNVVTVTDDKGIYPDDIVITREEKMRGLSFAVTENVDALQFAREAKRITPETNERGQTEEQAVEQQQAETTAPEQKNADLERAKKLINDFCDREYDSEGNFTDLKQVSLAYTEDEETALPIQVNADLEEYRLTYLFNNEVVKTEQYGSLAEMNDNALNWLNFDELIHEAIEAKENEIHKEKPAEPTAEITEIKNLAQLKRTLTVGTEFEITSYIRDDIVNQRRRVNYADTTAIYSIRPDAPDDTKTTLANNGRGSYLPWEKASDWEFANGVCTAYRKGKEHTEENRLFSIKVRQPVLKREAENRQTAEISNPLVKELAQTFPADTAEKLYNAFEGAKMANWNDNQAKINRVKRALYDILGNKEQTESAFAVLAAGETPKLRDIVIDLSPNTARYEREDIPEQTQDGGMTEKISEIAKAANAKIDYTITDEHLGEGGAKEKFAENIAAIETLKRIESRNLSLAADMFKAYNATPEEQKTLSRYVGWGGLPQAFDPNNKTWEKEYTQLKELLTPDEYEAARSTVLTAHYTSPTIISAIYSALENFGFKGGNVLEPSMGIGNFFGVMPEEMRSQSHLHGVELDDISGRIAKQLYPNADIQICGYENTAFSDNFFDAAVGNVPFGNYPVADTRYDREHFLIHDYFFAKTLDKVAPGGIVAFITSKGTFDKTSPKVREYLAKRADLIGAIRLPNNAFKGNAGTEVTSDIIFLQKREKMSVEKPDWCYTAQIAEGISVNQYFIDHPEMILGEMRLVSGRYGEETACVPIKGANLKEQLSGAVMRLKRDIMTVRHEKKRGEEHGIIPATADVRNFTFTEVDDKIYFRENNIMREIPFSKRNHERMRGMIGIRNTFRELVDAQSDGCSDEMLSGLQFRLNAEYDAFVMNFGHISDIENRKLFAVDDDYNTLCGGLELIDPETKEITKADVFTKRTIKPYAEVTHVNTPQEALFVSLDMRGSVDIDYMSGLCGAPREDVIKELADNGFIYKNPETEEYEEAAEYLSGYVQEKLRTAQKAAENDPGYERNAAALEKVLPPKLGAGDISVRLGAPWISIEDYCKFFNDYAKGTIQQGSLYSRATVLYRSVSGEYKIENKNADKSVASQSSFGTKRMNSYAIFENLLNNRDIAVYDSFELPDGKKKRVMNKDETQLAQEKARQMKEAFPKWLWADPERRDKYVNIYNELFNSLVGREYDGSHQTFPGMNPFIELNEHQKNAVMRAKLGGNTLLAHCVGAGKTFEMAAAVMEKRRLGLINKACVVVPKHLVGQMSAEWLRLYPEARLLTAKENDFNEANRQKFIGRCCTGDYDAVIMSYQQFQKIPMSVEYQQEFLGEQLNDLAAQLREFGNKHLFADDKRSIKDIERMKKNIEAKLKKLLDTPHDNSLSFEQLGFDCVVADEAHNYKNGLVVTKMQRVAGVQTTPAQKSEDILMKTQYLNETYGEKNILFATGTPVAGLQQLNAKFNFNSVFVGNFYNLNHSRGYLALFFER